MLFLPSTSTPVFLWVAADGGHAWVIDDGFAVFGKEVACFSCISCSQMGCQLVPCASGSFMIAAQLTRFQE